MGGVIFMYNVITFYTHIFSTCTYTLFMAMSYFISFIVNLSKQLRLRMSNNNNNKSSFNSVSSYSKNINDRGNKSPDEDEEIIVISTPPEICTSFPPIGRNIVILQTNCFSERKPVHDWKYFGKRISSYYQPQPDSRG